MHCDILLRGGVVYDGLGNPGFCADVAITDERIVAIGELEEWHGAQEVPVEGLCVAPAFIDIHTHADFSLNHHPEQISMLYQGVGTQVGGNCGLCIGQIDNSERFRQEQRWLKPYGVEITWRSMREYLQILDDLGLGTNYVPLCGHGTLRKKVMGFAKRAPTDSELRQMQEEVRACMEAGAFGFTTGLEYVPNAYAEPPEIVVLARVASEYGGFYATHLRSEGDFLVECVEEAIQIAEQAEIPLQLSHHKAEGEANWGKVHQTLQRVSEAVKGGLDVMLDVYPYTAYQTSLATVCLPDWALEGEPSEILQRLQAPDSRERILNAMRSRTFDWERAVIGSFPQRRELQGRTLAEAARQLGKSPEETVLDLLVEGGGHVGVAWFNMSEEDMLTVLQYPLTMVGSDGLGYDPERHKEERPHPRSYGTFPRVLGRYVREQGLMPLETAILKMTGLPAARLGLTDRGVLKPGAYADIVVFDFGRIRDHATFQDPHRLSEGVVHLLINGRWTLRDGQYTGVRAGRVLRKNA
ncbi:MAG: D-aminoacylase [Fimbriimonadales bacterium]|nr:D-aminoacylase [Fimbriimonadales bacterium]CUU35474.1 N-acyl-D-amino-acid deacylase [Armatimonadetes bacterium GXS]